uniref:Uncharacterized protein n=1 Tax=Cannabis sativa TaxID=3483 RepID=A0A803P6N4_CANSA
MSLQAHFSRQPLKWLFDQPEVLLSSSRLLQAMVDDFKQWMAEAALRNGDDRFSCWILPRIFVIAFPNIDMSYEVLEGDNELHGDVVTLQVTLGRIWKEGQRGGAVRCPRYPKAKKEGWWLCSR